MKYQFIGKAKTVKELVNILRENVVDEDATVTAMGAECNIIIGYDENNGNVVSVVFEDEDRSEEWNEEEM